MENFLARSFRISSFDTDPLGRARLTTLAGFFQEMAYLHAGGLGFGYRDLEQKNSFWVLSRIKIGIDRYPFWDEEVMVETWHNGVERLFGLREFRVFDRDEHPVARATSAWLILDAKTRRPLRPDENLLNAGTGRGFLFEGRPERIDIPGNAGLLSTRRVAYSDLDIMGHVNNVKYMEWCIDLCMETSDPAGPGLGIQELEINYKGEARQGDSVEILGSRGQLPDGSGGAGKIFFLARDGTSGKEIFRAGVLFGPSGRGGPGSR